MLLDGAVCSGGALYDTAYYHCMQGLLSNGKSIRPTVKRCYTPSVQLMPASDSRKCKGRAVLAVPVWLRAVVKASIN